MCWMIEQLWEHNFMATFSRKNKSFYYFFCLESNQLNYPISIFFFLLQIWYHFWAKNINSTSTIVREHPVSCVTFDQLLSWFCFHQIQSELYLFKTIKWKKVNNFFVFIAFLLLSLQSEKNEQIKCEGKVLKKR